MAALAVLLAMTSAWCFWRAGYMHAWNRARAIYRTTELHWTVKGGYPDTGVGG